MMEQLVFYLFAFLLLLSAGLVITVRNPVFAALSLILAFFSSAAIWILLEAEFLAITLVLVYVGAVMVLFMFVVMMLDIDLAKLRADFIRYLPVGGIVIVLLAGAMGLVLYSADFDLAAGQKHGPNYSNVSELGKALYTDYLYPFEIAGAILLVAIIAAIVLTMRPPRSNRTQKPEKQVAVKRDNRLRLVQMQTASPEAVSEPESKSEQS